jgi:predicted transcriptional regulator
MAIRAIWNKPVVGSRRRHHITSDGHDERLKPAAHCRPETEAANQRRLAHEADARDPNGVERRRARTLKGLADVDAGRLIDDEAMQAWADSLETDHEIPAPLPR